MPETSDNNSALNSVELGYRAAVRSAWVAGVFTAVVCLLLVAGYHPKQPKDPLDSVDLQALKARLAEEPQNEKLIEQIRRQDLILREMYFQRRDSAARGTWLLLGGIVVFLVAVKLATTLKRKLPMPGPHSIPQDTESRMTTVARWSVAGLLLILVGTAITLSASFRTELPELPLGPPDQVQVPPEEPDYPSDEEIRKYWPRFRGPGGLGVSAYTNVPASWDGESGQGILWKRAVPLPGNNSPVVWADKVFLSGADEKRREVYCFDADSGELLWQKEVPGTPTSTAEPPEVAEDTGYAAPTVTTDGRRVFAMFANGDLAGFDFDGNVVWSKSFGIPDNFYGHAASLAMHQGKLLIQFDQGGMDDELSKLLALDARSGKTVWETARKMPNSWSSPIVIDHQGRRQIITCGDPWTVAYDPADGKELWRAKCLRQDVGPTPVYAGGLVFTVTEYLQLSAIRPDGEGDVTDTHILWTAEDGLPDTCSPLATEEHVYVLASYGYLTCYDAKSGELLWEWESDDASFVSSPSLVGNRIYLFDVEGRTWIIEPGPDGGKTVGEAALGEECVSSPAFQDGRIYIRGKEHLFCIGQK